MTIKFSNKDIKNFIEKKSFKTHRTLDLHGYTLQKANEVVDDPLLNKNFKEGTR